MSERDEALLFVCDEAACHEDQMFYEIFTMDDRWSIIRKILDAAVQSGRLARTDAALFSPEKIEPTDALGQTASEVYSPEVLDAMTRAPDENSK